MIRSKDTETHIAGVTGGLFGITTSELISEFSARALGLTAWKKFGVKAVIKGLLGALYLFLMGRVPGVWGVFLLVAGWGGIATIAVDLISAIIPGGIPRIAQEAAVKVRSAAVGAEAVAKELEVLEMTAKSVEKRDVVKEVWTAR